MNPRSEDSAVESAVEFGARAEAWIAERRPRRPSLDGPLRWGEGSDGVALFHNLSPSEERAVVDDQRAWYSEKATQGFHAIDGWVVNGQKVWTSGAQFADFGYLLARTDPDVPKHKGITGFIVDMRSPGVTVRPLRQMSGGSSFNEVFFDDAVIHDSMRLGDVGQGWAVAMTTLGFERGSTGGGGAGRSVGGHMIRLLQLAEHTGAGADPVIRQALARAWTNQRLLGMNAQRVKAKSRAGQTPGPEGSIGKLAWTKGLREMAAVASQILGPRLTADTGEWGTYAWVDFLLGGCGYRVAGGTDEIQRNIIAERALGLLREPDPSNATKL